MSDGARMSPARILGDEITASLAASLLLGALEAALLRQVGAALVALALLGALGVAIGLVWALAEGAVRRFRLGPAPAAIVRAAAAWPAFSFVAAHLFEGARAAALPGAAWGALWVPALGVVSLTGVLFAGSRLLAGGSRARRGAVGLFCLAIVAAVEVANRSLYRSEYPDVHAFLVIVSCAALAIGLRIGVGRRSRRGGRRRWVLGAGAAALAAGGLAAALAAGLEGPQSRWAVATRGTHGRQLARLLREVFDRDGDGFSAVLGGGDCDDGDARVSPAGIEVAANGVDEDCDGEDLARPPPPPPGAAEARARARAELLGRPDVRALFERAREMNVIIILVDALRYDAVASPPARAACPALTSFFAGARRFSRAFAPAAGTDLSVSSVITGRINPFSRVNTTLPEALRDSGRATRAIFPREVLRYAGRVLLSRGIERVDRYVNDREQRNVGSYTTSVTTTDLALRDLDELSRRRRPFYLWVHYFDVHEHKQVEPGDAGLRRAGSGFDLDDPAGKYRALVALTDREIGRLLSALDERGLSDHTIVVFMSDHGESLGEDPRLPDAHGRFVYNPLTHVPLAIRVPGVRPAKVAAPVSLIDLTPTLFELAGLEPPDELGGVSLLPHLVDRAPAPLLDRGRPIIMNEQEQWGIIAWPMKLMVRPADNLTELYDLERDFGETRDLSRERPDVVRRLKALYFAVPRVVLDRTREGRRERDRRARPPKKR